MTIKNIFKQLLAGWKIKKEKRNKEEILFQEMDRIIKETGSKIYLAKGYRKKMLPAIQYASDMIIKMIPTIPGPIDLNSSAMEDNHILDAIFTNPEEFSEWFEKHKSLHEPFQKSNLNQFIGLLVADYRSKTIFGSKMQGELLIRDIPQKAILFSNPRIVVSAATLIEAEKELRHRILLMLFIQALDEINELNLWKEELKHQHDLLSFKLGGNGSSETDSSDTLEETDLQETEQVLEEINEKLEEIDKDIDTPEKRLAKIINVLQSPALYLQMGTFTIESDRNGIWVRRTLEEAEYHLTMAECKIHGNEKRVLVWVQMKRTTKL